MKGTIILAAGAAIALLGWGGVMLSDTLECRGHEDDYLNAISSLKGNAMIRGVTDDPDVTAGLQRIEEQNLERAELTLARIYSECGERAGQTAARKGSELLL